MAKKLALVPMKKRIAEIQSVYANTAERIVGLLSSLDPTTYTTAESGRVLREIKLVIAGLDMNVRMWAPDAIKAAYDESAGVARTRLEMIGAEPSNRYNQARHGKKIAALTKTVIADFWKANRTIEKTARKYLSVIGQAAAGVAKVQAQAQMFDPAAVKSFIQRTVSASLRAKTKYNAGTAHLTSKDIAAKIRKKLLSQIGGEDFIVINGRNYNLKAYSELVARTRMRESQTEATLEMCREFENDLVQFSKHDNPCDDCKQYEGEIFSVSGNHPTYPILPDEARCPVHPRCEHNLNPTSDNALRWRKSA